VARVAFLRDSLARGHGKAQFSQGDRVKKICRDPLIPVAGDGDGADWGDAGALGEAAVFPHYFKYLADPRQRSKVPYPLDEVLLLHLLSVLAESEAITDVARFGEKKPLRFAFRELGIRLLDAAPGRCTIPTRTVR